MRVPDIIRSMTMNYIAIDTEQRFLWILDRQWGHIVGRDLWIHWVGLIGKMLYGISNRGRECRCGSLSREHFKSYSKAKRVLVVQLIAWVRHSLGLLK
jgi:hypothetical protein